MNYDEEDRLGAAEDLAPISQGGSGQLVTISAPGEDVFDPATDTNIPGPPVVQTGSGVEEVYSAHSIAGGLVQSGDVKFLLSALQFNGDETLVSPASAITTPVADLHTLTKADGAWAIKKVDALSPAGLPIIFTLQLRRGG